MSVTKLQEYLNTTELPNCILSLRNLKQVYLPHPINRNTIIQMRHKHDDMNKRKSTTNVTTTVILVYNKDVQ